MASPTIKGYLHESYAHQVAHCPTMSTMQLGLLLVCVVQQCATRVCT
jgi:hypothetical protein